MNYPRKRSRDISVDTATDYELDSQGSNPGRGKNFFFFHNVRTGYGGHPASYPMGTRDDFPGGKADHSPAASTAVKNVGAIPPLPTSSWYSA
jgi:hypothetical protein